MGSQFLMMNMTNQTQIDRPRIFVSHAWENKPLVRRLEAKLKAAGAEVWVDHTGIRAGDNLPERVSDALEWCNVLLLIWSEAAQSSHWVKLEWMTALSLNKTLIPCVLDDTALPAILASKAYVDFRSLNQGLAGLLRALDLSQQTTVPPSISSTERAVSTSGSAKSGNARSLKRYINAIASMEIIPRSQWPEEYEVQPSDFRDVFFKRIDGREALRGKKHDVRVIRDCLLGNTSRTILIIGEAGIGKTTLCKWLAKIISSDFKKKANKQKYLPFFSF